MRQAVVYVLVATLSLLLLVVGYSWYYRNWKTYHGYTPRPFSPEAWALADSETRGHMLDDLLARRLLDGRSCDEVQDLLGPPDDGGKFGLRYRTGYLGFNPRAPLVFSYTLMIDLDERGRVKRVTYGD